MISFDIQTHESKQVVDITDIIQAKVKESRCVKGLCNIFICHTTAALTTADLDPGTDLDMIDAFEAMMPKLDYRHAHNPPHVVDHILASIIGPSVMLPINNNEVLLGIWQRIVVIELDGPRKRELVLTIIPE